MHDIESHITGAHLAEEGVEVGTIIIEEPTGFMHEVGDLEDLGFEHTDGVGVGHHDTSYSVIEQRFEVLDIDSAIRFRLDLDDIEASYHSRSGVSAVSGVGDDDASALGVAARDVILAHHHQTGELAMSTGVRIERKLSEAGDIGESLLEVIIEFESALYGVGVLQWVNSSELRHCGDLLIDFGVILHGATTEGIEPGVDAEVFVREIGIMSYDIHLADLGEERLLYAAEISGDRSETIGIELVGGELETDTTGVRDLKNQFIILLHLISPPSLS